MKTSFTTKYLGIGIGIIAACLLIVPSAFGIDLGIGSIVAPAAEQAGFESADETTLAVTIGKLVRSAISLLGIVFTLLVVYAGMKWMLARGNEGEVEDAQKILRNAVIGLLLTVGSYALTNFFLKIFTS